MPHTHTSVEARRKAFRDLHQSGCFVLPNPWDIGSAIYLQHLGFKAVASTSAGFAFSQGLPDAGVSLDAVLAHLRALCAAVDIPVNADFEGGYADDPEDVARNVALCVQTGIAGLSIEDAAGDTAEPLYPFDMAVARVKAARAAIYKSGSGVAFTARSEGFIRNRPDLDETIRRLKAFAEAGADCLYAPGLRNKDEMSAVIEALAPKPVNILIGADLGLSVGDIAAMGARRISVGGALTRSAWTGFSKAAREIAEQGTFSGLAGLMPFAELDGLFAEHANMKS